MNVKENLATYVFEYSGNQTLFFNRTRKYFNGNIWSKFKELFYSQIRSEFRPIIGYLSSKERHQIPLSSSEKLSLTESILKEL